jgi:hypothetical protein
MVFPMYTISNQIGSLKGVFGQLCCPKTPYIIFPPSGKGGLEEGWE